LLQAWVALRGQPPSKRRASHIDSFVKLEAYGELKEGRMINSRSDFFKVYCGHLIKRIEDEVYKLPYFAKKMTPQQKQERIKNMRSVLLKIYENDFSGFEGSLVSEFVDVCECELFRYMLEPNYPEAAKVICETDAGLNRCRTKLGLFLAIWGRRMSGDMWTSLGNGFSNLCLWMFAAWLKGGHLIDGLVEGDDALVSMDVDLDEKDFERLGFVTRGMHQLQDPCDGHFCGMIFGPTGEIIKDPRSVLQKFGWTHSFIGAGHRVMDSLLRCKALSLAYELPQCPIAGALAREAIKLTQGVSLTHVEESYNTMGVDLASIKIPPFAPSLGTREYFEHRFGVSVSAQLAIEDAIYRHDMLSVAQMLPATADMQWYEARYVEPG